MPSPPGFAAPVSRSAPPSISELRGERSPEPPEVVRLEADSAGGIAAVEVEGDASGVVEGAMDRQAVPALAVPRSFAGEPLGLDVVQEQERADACLRSRTAVFGAPDSRRCAVRGRILGRRVVVVGGSSARSGADRALRVDRHAEAAVRSPAHRAGELALADPQPLDRRALEPKRLGRRRRASAGLGPPARRRPTTARRGCPPGRSRASNCALAFSPTCFAIPASASSSAAAVRSSCACTSAAPSLVAGVARLHADRAIEESPLGQPQGARRRGIEPPDDPDRVAGLGVVDAMTQRDVHRARAEDQRRPRRRSLRRRT